MIVPEEIAEHSETYIIERCGPVLECVTGTGSSYQAVLGITYRLDEWFNLLDTKPAHPKAIARNSIHDYFKRNRTLILPIIRDLESAGSTFKRIVKYEFGVLVPFNPMDFHSPEFTV